MSQAQQNVTVYTPESLIRNPIKLFRELISDLVHSRELIMALLVRDIKAQYRQTILGYLWIIAPPLATTGMWFYLNSQNLINVAETDIPYPAFVLLGQILWGTFSAAVMAPLNGFNAGKSIFTKLNVSPEAFIFAGIGKNLFDIGVKLLLVLGVLWWIDVGISWTFILFLLDIAAIVIFGIGLGIFLIPIGSLYQDVVKAVGLALPFLMYLTPVVYPPPENSDGIAGTIINYNPLTPLIMAGRDWLTLGSSPYGTQMLITAGISFVFFLFGSLVMRIVLPRLIERMGM